MSVYLDQVGGKVDKEDLLNYHFEGDEFVVNLLGIVGYEFYTEQFLEMLAEYRPDKVRLNIYSVGGYNSPPFRVHSIVLLC